MVQKRSGTAGGGSHSRLKPLADGIWSFPSRFEEFPGGPDSTGYLIEGGDGMLTVIDPGWNTVHNLAQLLADLSYFGDSRLATVTGTHLHIDHLGLAASLAANTGARMLVHEPELRAMHEGPRLAVDAYATWGVPPERRAELELRWTNRPFSHAGEAEAIGDGAMLPIAGRHIEALHTPGHTSGHLCFVDRDAGLLFCGDHVLEGIRPGLGLGGFSETNPLTDYLASIERVLELGDVLGLPGHGGPIEDLPARAGKLAAHHRQRTEEVAAALDRLGEPSLWELAHAVRWRGGFDALHDYALGSALAQTEYHVRALGRTAELRVPRYRDGRLAGAAAGETSPA
ncbi:MAG: MBL fold metallo-hydrolase [Humibacter sp.]